MIKKIFLFLFAFMLLCRESPAEELWLQNISVKKLNELYDLIGYTGITDKNWLMLPSKRYPPVFLKKLPSDFNQITDKDQSNALFIKILIPLALKLNQELLDERQTIVKLQKKFLSEQTLSKKEIDILEKKAARYDVFTRLKDKERFRFLISELLNRIDVIPPSVMITLACVETDFGSSRIVKEGNALYKLLVWHTSEGLKPIGETEDDSYRIKTYADIYKSMQDFALRINSHPNFEFLRTARASSREAATTPRIKGETFIAYAFPNSELKNYAGIIEYTLAYYELSIVDQSVFDTKMITPKISKQYSKF